MDERRVSANRPWERTVGYSRAVRVGDVIEVSGTAPADEEGRITAVGDLFQQTRNSLRIIGDALNEIGSGFEDVIRTRMYLKDVSKWLEAGRAHGEIFSSIRPANTIVGATGFVDPEILVEIEVTAIVRRGAQ
jgi:enamine deaminase RidA (YjgF/YER057c/UK114 family)